MRMVRYTTKLHVYRLKLMLKKEDELTELCPAARRFNACNSPYTLYKDDTDCRSPCNICGEFIGLNTVMDKTCPCHVYGKELAYTLTHRLIQEYEKETKDASRED